MVVIYGDEDGWSSSTEMKFALGLLQEDDFVSFDGVSPIWVTFSLFIKITQQHRFFFSLELSVVWSDVNVSWPERGPIQIPYLFIIRKNLIPLRLAFENNFHGSEAVLNIASNAESPYRLYLQVHGFY